MTAWRALARTTAKEQRSTRGAVCSIPNPLDSAEQWDSYYHLDLEGVPRLELLLIRTRVFLRLADERPPHPWLLERLHEVQRRLKDEH